MPAATVLTTPGQWHLPAAPAVSLPMNCFEIRGGPPVTGHGAICTWPGCTTGGIGTPRGFVRYFSFPHTAAVTPESLRSSLGRGGIGTPRGVVRYFSFPTQRRLHPSPSGPAWAAGG